MYYHNWWQFHKVLLKLGYRQVLDYDNQFLYYENSFGEKITIMKSNKLDIVYAHRKVRQIGIDYKVFERLFREIDDAESI